MGVTNQRAEKFFWTNQNQAYSTRDQNDVSMPKYGHKIHVTPWGKEHAHINV